MLTRPVLAGPGPSRDPPEPRCWRHRASPLRSRRPLRCHRAGDRWRGTHRLPHQHPTAEPRGPPGVLVRHERLPRPRVRRPLRRPLLGPGHGPGRRPGRALVRKVVAEADYVIHAAALADVAACTREPLAAIDTNVAGTQTVLDAVAATDRVRRLVFVSSASFYGDGNPEETDSPVLLTMRQLLESVHGRIPPQFHEFTRMRPKSVYGNAKAWGEEQTALVLGQVGTSYAIVRYFSVYGEPQTIKQNSHSWVVAWFAARAHLGLLLHLNGGGHQVRDLVNVDDVAEGTLRALISPRAHTETVNIGTACPPPCARSPSWCSATIRTRRSWTRRCRPVTRWAGTRPSGRWRTSWAGSRRSASRKASTAT
ncbi:NAD-dependent epimerase/dehydratase family protein [Streptomyces sp. NPDC016309]|uniref:NAD-dependent epimerase/dehydratase family protein n=1 Tax=Streptomyces sp. NPDC016309 TaxID=3364965 RepID=UPI0036FA69F0